MENLHRNLSERMNWIDSSQIRRAFDLAAKLENPINLSIGQPHYPTPKPILEAVNKAMMDGKNSYTPTQGILPLRERISRIESAACRSIPPDQILISSGVSSLLQLIFMTVMDPQDEILLIDPYFLMYKSLSDFFRAKITTIPENFTKEDIEKLSFTKLKLILFASPSNPTGTILTKEQISLLGNLADKTGALLVSDEIYNLFDYDQTFISAGEVYPEALVLRGFSKTYSMTGLRLAWASGPEFIIKAMTVLQQYTIVCAPSVVQWAGLTALDLNMQEYVDLYKKNRNLCIAKLQNKTQFPYPAGAFYVFPKINGLDQKFVERAALEKKLIIVPGSIFSDKKDHIRISFATTEEKLKEGLDAFLELL